MIVIGIDPHMKTHTAVAHDAATLRPVAASSATTVWVFMCGSIPITIMRFPSRGAYPMAGTAGGHALVRAYWPGSYQVTSVTPRFPAVEDETAEGQPLGVTERFGSLRRRARGSLPGVR